MSLQSILYPSATNTSAGNTGTAQTLPANTRGAVFNINVSAASGTNPTLAVSLQWLDPASNTYVTLATASNIIATGNTQLVVYPGVSSPLYGVLPSGYRLSWAIGGTNAPSFTFSIGANYLN